MFLLCKIKINLKLNLVRRDISDSLIHQIHYSSISNELNFRDERIHQWIKCCAFYFLIKFCSTNDHKSSDVMFCQTFRFQTVLLWLIWIFLLTATLAQQKVLCQRDLTIVLLHLVSTNSVQRDVTVKSILGFSRHRESC